MKIAAFFYSSTLYMITPPSSFLGHLP